jgi:hypothetical protein
MTTPSPAEVLATAPSLEIRELCVRIAGKDGETLARVTKRAVAGDAEAVRSYVGSYRSVTRAYLVAIHGWRPDLVSERSNGFLIADIHGHQSEEPWEVIELGAAEAPFSSWTAVWGLRDGTVAFLLASIRQAIPKLPPLSPPAQHGVNAFHKGSPTRFAQLVLAQLRGERHPVERVMEVFGLTQTEMGTLFGVTGEAVRGWVPNVPASRRAKLTAMVALGDLLERKLKPGLVPSIARTPAAAYGGRSMLDRIREDGHQELLDLTKRSFDWSATA